ncbi:hypothetical protein [Kribbella italica]|uniref:PH domain-containing protein n=1 Tax=Kribbella italica TaxID=1540520 RepID=A0A7W9JDB4_9ACTN|nr:hypothetical protein [Kribbella italica]MBB5839590.1 hypothetical protein [Kribbella italica]
MDLKPMLITRIAQTVLWLAVAGVLVGYLISTRSAWPLTVGLSVVIVAVALFLIVRTHRMGVRYGPEGLEVRGILLSRSIPAEQVVRVTGFPAVRWTTATGSNRWTPISAFYGIGQLGSVERYNQFCILQLQTWDEGRHPKPPSTGNPRRPRRGK